jgi:hypothetical protein
MTFALFGRGRMYKMACTGHTLRDFMPVDICMENDLNDITASMLSALRE